MHARFALAMFAFIFGTTSPAHAAPPPSDEDEAAAAAKGHEHGGKGELEKGKHHDKLPPGLAGRSDERHRLLLERFEKRRNTADERRSRCSPVVRANRNRRTLRRRARRPHRP
jgi:hypothetical protein